MKSTEIAILIIILLISSFSFGLGQEHFGPADKEQMSWSPDWATGTKALLAHESRVYSTWVNGFERFYFDATPQQVNELLDLFSKLQILEHEVWIENGRQTRNSFGGKLVEYNVFFYIPGKLGASYLGLRADERLEDGWTLPTLRIYADSQDELLKQLKLPDNLIVHSDIANCPKTKTRKPIRKPYVTRFLLEDETPASGMGFVTKITLWKKGQQQGYILGNAGFQGIFEMFFSDHEMAKLRSGDMWLTVTYGNQTIKPKPIDQTIPFEYLTEHTLFHPKTQEERPKHDNQSDFILDFLTAYSHAKTFVVEKASSIEYYGRLVYEDDASGVNGPELAPREIMITMPWQVVMEVDEEGYFKVIYSEEQFEQLINDKAKGTVIIRSSEKESRSTANVKFSLDILSTEKEKAGIVNIP